MNGSKKGLIYNDEKPVGQLLSETEAGVDYLGGTVYADAIAESIHNAKTAITIGIYARWGSGKSFLLRHIESILRRYQKQDNLDATGTIKTYGWHRTKRFLGWVFALLFVLAVFVVSVLLAANPALFLPAVTANNSTTNVTTTNVTTTAPSATVIRQNTLNTMQIIGCVLIPIELLLVFLIARYGISGTRHSSYGGFEILTYTAFTKIPMQINTAEIMEDPGENPASMLKFVKPRNKILAMAAAAEVRFPRRYIFANFKAWEYAGSDTLWAAIVTNISDAIEAEFGIITTRLFRTLTVTEVPKKALGRRDKSLYIPFKAGTSEKDIREVMKRYGVVTSVAKTASNPDSEYHTYEITYSNDGEFRNAKESLRIEGVNVKTTRPDPTRYSNRNGSRRARNNIEEKIELLDLNEDDNEDKLDEQAPTEELEGASNLFCCCRSFCTHFIRYPVTLCRLPRLIWWIILLFASILIPVTAYIIASILNLRTVQTYWNVPPYAQALLWLPGPLSVTLFAVKFTYAMCNSQTSRINKALDGTQGRVASQLGFMNIVKQEIEVMTNLIRCARFVYKKDFRVIITIDDLDQVDLKKVTSVLEAVSILLSDKASPFICLVAADPRIVSKCVEDSLGSALNNANVTGREYMEKIINLPVCLPDLNESRKRRYIAGLIDQSDRTNKYRTYHMKKSERENRPRDDCVDGPGAASNGYADGGVGTDIGHEKFLWQCRKCLYENDDLRRHVRGNARNMKKFFNVISLTTSLINCIVKKQGMQEFMSKNVRRMEGRDVNAQAVEGVQKIIRTKEFAKMLVHWIVLVDEWPCRASYIIQVIEDSEQRVHAGLEDERIPEDWTILKIYLEKVQSGLLDHVDKSLLTLDGDPDLFQTYMLLLKERNLTKADIMFLLPITINLDNSIRRKIAMSLPPIPIKESSGRERPEDVVDIGFPMPKEKNKNNVHPAIMTAVVSGNIPPTNIEDSAMGEPVETRC